MRFKAKRGTAEHGSKSAEAADHLVRDHVHVICTANLHHFVKVAFRRNDHAASTHHRLRDKGGNRVRILFANELVEFARQSLCEFLLRLARLGEAVMVRTAHVQNPSERQIEIQVIVRQTRERCRHHGHPVIGLAAADDLLFSWPTERVVHVPDELDLTVIGLRARGAEEHFRGRNRGDLFEPFGELDRGIMALGGEKVAKGKLTHLRRSGLDQLFVAVAKRRAPQPRHPFDIGPALGVVDEHALSALDDQRTGFAQRREIGVGVNQGLEVADGEIAERGHDLASSLQRYGR